MKNIITAILWIICTPIKVIILLIIELNKFLPNEWETLTIILQTILKSLP